MSEFIKHTPGALCSSGEWRVAFDHVRRGRVQGLKVPYKRIHLNRVMSKRTKRAVRKVAVFWILDFGFWLQKMFADPHTTRHAAPPRQNRPIGTWQQATAAAAKLAKFCQFLPSTKHLCCVSLSLSFVSLLFLPCSLLPPGSSRSLFSHMLLFCLVSVSLIPHLSPSREKQQLVKWSATHNRKDIK